MVDPIAVAIFPLSITHFWEDKPDEKGMSLSMKIARETASFIEQNYKEPFFAYMCFYAVHAPIQTTQEKWGKYQKKAVE